MARKQNSLDSEDDDDDGGGGKESGGRLSEMEEGEVSDSSDADDFDDGLDDNLMGDEEDRLKLEAMTEKEREQVIYERLERREALKTR